MLQPGKPQRYRIADCSGFVVGLSVGDDLGLTAGIAAECLTESKNVGASCCCVLQLSNEPNLEMANSSASAMWLGAAEIDRFEEFPILIDVAIDHRHRGALHFESESDARGRVESKRIQRIQGPNPGILVERPGYKFVCAQFFSQRECMSLCPWDVSVCALLYLISKDLRT